MGSAAHPGGAGAIDLLTAYLARGSTVDQLRSLLLACARKGAAPRATFDPVTCCDIGDGLRAVFGTSEQRAELIQSLALTGNDKRYVPVWVEQIGRAVENWDGSASGALATCGVIRNNGKTEPGPNLLSRLTKRGGGSTENLLRRALALPSLEAAMVSVMLPPVLARVGVVKAERGMFDYDDMLRLVRDALLAPGGDQLARRLRDRTPWVMIDEFQDTDRIQWDIFRTIWMTPESKGLTIVGDPKQAIYGFRGADVSTYCDARDALVNSGATVVQLDVNYRATPEMVHAVNRILAGDGITPLLGPIIRYDHPVQPSTEITSFHAPGPSPVEDFSLVRECEGRSLRPPITVFAMQGAGKREANRRALAHAIGAEIEALRQSPVPWACRGESPPFSLSQVMVLTRTNKESGEIAGALRARGLACSVVESDRLFETREAAELVAVLAAVAAPRDRSARMRALRSRFFDVPWTDLMQVVDAPDYHPLIARLLDWAALANRRAYEPLLRSIVEDSRFAERAIVIGGGERAIINTWHLIEILLGEVARSRCDLHELVTQLRRWIADGSDHPDDRDIQRSESDTDAIRILTVHKAKGLEAPYVFVFGAASPPQFSTVHTVRDTTGSSLVVGPQPEGVATLVQAEASAEHQRLAYVALTRAKVRLYLPWYTDGVVDAKSMYHSIQRCLVPLVKHHSEHFEMINVDLDQVTSAEIPSDALVGFELPPVPQVNERTAVSGRSAGIAIVSYSRLRKAPQEMATLALPHSQSAFDEPDGEQPTLPVAAGELPAGVQSGLLLHDLLERADLDEVRLASDAGTWARLPQTARLIADCARARGIAATYYDHAAHIAFTTLTQPLVTGVDETLPPLVHAKWLAREVEFSYPIHSHSAGYRSGLVKGYIDALAVWDEELWVVDYKSDVLVGEPIRAAADHVQNRYAVQQRLYALAADRMRGERRLAGMLFPFVRYGVAIAVRCDSDQIAAWSTWLIDLARAA